MGLFSWGKKRRNYATGALAVQNPFVKRVFAQVTGELHKLNPTRDMNYLALDRRQLESFTWKYHNPAIAYHSNSDEFPDCDDFALMARGSIVYGAAKEGLRYAPVFGGLSYFSRRLKGWHRANWAITAAGELLVFEPQSGAWYDYADEVQELRQASI